MEKGGKEKCVSKTALTQDLCALDMPSEKSKTQPGPRAIERKKMARGRPCLIEGTWDDARRARRQRKQHDETKTLQMKQKSSREAKQEGHKDCARAGVGM